MKKLDINNLTTKCKLIIYIEDHIELKKHLEYLELEYSDEDQSELQPGEYRLITNTRLLQMQLYFLKGKVIQIRKKVFKSNEKPIYDKTIVVGIGRQCELIYKQIN